jgi:hypothetical protein
VTTPSFPAAPRDLPDERRHRREMATVVNRINTGKFNATGELTLRANETTTVLTDPRLTPTSFLGLWPLTANAAAELDAQHPYAAEANRGGGVWTLTHRSNAGTDRTFRYLIIG